MEVEVMEVEVIMIMEERKIVSINIINHLKIEFTQYNKSINVKSNLKIYFLTQLFGKVRQLKSGMMPNARILKI